MWSGFWTRPAAPSTDTKGPAMTATIDASRVIRSGTPILFVTLDSLRYDVAATALADGATPRLARLLPGGSWERR